MDGFGLKEMGMKRLFVCLAFLWSGCGSLAQVSLAPRRPEGVDQTVVESFVCRGETQEALRYVLLRGGSEADWIERTERARREVAGRPGCPCFDKACKEAK